ncbi:MAG: histidine phosphatase family protein [Tannerellaceae bacterium]
MIITIVRHGETIENSRRICQGQLPGTLSEQGILQAQQLAESLAENVAPDAIVTSDLQRAIDTAEILRQAIAPTLQLQTDERLRERGFGSFQGCVFPEEESELHLPFDAETEQSLLQRTQSMAASLIALPFRHVLVVSHGVTIKALLAYLLEDISLYDTLPIVGNCSVSELIINNHINRNRKLSKLNVSLKKEV